MRKNARPDAEKILDEMLEEVGIKIPQELTYSARSHVVIWELLWHFKAKDIFARVKCGLPVYGMSKLYYSSKAREISRIKNILVTMDQGER